MGARYTSQKPDGYMNVRNSIYQDRREKLQYMDFERSSACRNLAPQTKANYGKVDYK